MTPDPAARLALIAAELAALCEPGPEGVPPWPLPDLLREVARAAVERERGRVLGVLLDVRKLYGEDCEANAVADEALAAAAECVRSPATGPAEGQWRVRERAAREFARRHGLEGPK